MNIAWNQSKVTTVSVELLATRRSTACGHSLAKMLNFCSGTRQQDWWQRCSYTRTIAEVWEKCLWWPWETLRGWQIFFCQFFFPVFFWFQSIFFSDHRLPVQLRASSRHICRMTHSCCGCAFTQQGCTRAVANNQDILHALDTSFLSYAYYAYGEPLQVWVLCLQLQLHCFIPFFVFSCLFFVCFLCWLVPFPCDVLICFEMRVGQTY